MDFAASLIERCVQAGLAPPIIVSAAYWISIQVFQPPSPAKVDKIAGSSQSQSKAPITTNNGHALNAFVVFHNAILCIFSVLCFLKTFPVLFGLVSDKGLYDGLCGVKDAYESTVYGDWSYLFYLSKYYEIVDTYIVMAKGRRPINLQIYHHIGAMIGCAWFHHDRAVGSFIFIVPNSFIHSIMYLYYAVSTLKIRVPFKFVITYMQMVQFLFGHTCIVYVLYMLYPSCISVSERACLMYHFVYITWLFWMFARFFKKTYTKNLKKEN